MNLTRNGNENANEKFVTACTKEEGMALRAVQRGQSSAASNNEDNCFEGPKRMK